MMFVIYYTQYTLVSLLGTITHLKGISCQIKIFIKIKSHNFMLVYREG